MERRTIFVLLMAVAYAILLSMTALTAVQADGDVWDEVCAPALSVLLFLGVLTLNVLCPEWLNKYSRQLVRRQGSWVWESKRKNFVADTEGRRCVPYGVAMVCFALTFVGLDRIVVAPLILPEVLVLVLSAVALVVGAVLLFWIEISLFHNKR